MKKTIIIVSILIPIFLIWVIVTSTIDYPFWLSIGLGIIILTVGEGGIWLWYVIYEEIKSKGG